MNAKTVCKIIEQVNPDVIAEKTNNPDLEKTKEEVKKIQDQLAKLKITIHKEKEAGKSQNLLDGLKRQWQQLQDKIAQAWKHYDQKYGTKYAAAYEAKEYCE